MDEFDKANSLADQHMKMYQDDFTEIKDVAGLFFDKKEFATSLKYYSRAQEIKPDDSSLKPQLAMCLWGTDKKDDAVTQTIAFLDESKSNKEALAEGISLLVMFEKTGLAQTYLQDMRKIAPESSEFLSFEGYFAQQNKQEEKAISFYKKAFTADSKNMNNVTNLIEILIYNEKWADALNYLREALATHPNEPYILERSGTLLITCQDKSLRNINMGKELSERAFYHTAILPDAMVSAGRSLVVAYATLKDYQTAKYYMSVVLDLAKRANIRKDMMDDLEALNTQLAAYN